MRFYQDYVVPRLVKIVCTSRSLIQWRVLATGELSGTVLEIGFGSGANLGLYPRAVSLVVAAEPSSFAIHNVGKKIKESSTPVERVRSDAQALPFAESAFDSALVTFTLCTVADPDLVLSEIRRVLKPYGKLWYLEHGIAQDPGVRRWQYRLDGLQARIAGGCHLTRDATSVISRSGFEVSLRKQGFGTSPKTWSYFTVGEAINSK